jgi:hypothetical protein
VEGIVIEREGLEFEFEKDSEAFGVGNAYMDDDRSV